jgi:hypothetical protein
MKAESGGWYLSRCRKLIEEKLLWGESENWQNKDFENLSEAIFEETKVSLSPSTLKRIWGKAAYTSSPNLTTLDALAQFAGYSSWRAYTTSTKETKPTKILGGFARLNWHKTILWPLVIVFCGLAVALILAFRKSISLLKYDQVVFESKPVTLGLPNTVIFTYNVSNSTADSIFIQQSWDARLRSKVDKNKNEFTTTYYYPGYYRAKLILNDSIVKEHDVYVKTNGWLATVSNSLIPYYIEETHLLKDKVIGVSENDLDNLKIKNSESIPEISLFNVQDFDGLPETDFVFETELRSTYNAGNAVCQQVRIILMFSNGHISVPLSIKGCVGELRLSISENVIDGKTSDLSGFGVDFANMAKVRIEAGNGMVTFLINNIEAYKSELPAKIGKIVGLRYLFNGPGEVGYANFQKSQGGTLKLVPLND